MTHEERIEATSDALDGLKDARQNKKYNKRQTAASVLGDTRRTAEIVYREVRGFFLLYCED